MNRGQLTNMPYLKPEDKKNTIIQTRVDDDTYNSIIKFCKKNKLTVSNLIRVGIKKIVSE